MRTLILAAVLLSGCGLDMMGNRSSELSAPTVSALTREADGTEVVGLAFKDTSREYLERTTATSSGPWLKDTRVASERELQLRFGEGFAQAMAGQGPYEVTLTLPDQSQMSHCPCCRHASHVVKVELAFDQAGAMSNGTVTQLVK